MTPHYPSAEDELHVNPIPIVYLTVAPGTVFEFLVYWKERRRVKPGFGLSSTYDVNTFGLLDRAVIHALSMGIGAKTSVGYSCFKISNYKMVKKDELK